MPLVTIAKKLFPDRRGALGDQTHDVDCRQEVSEGVMCIVTAKAIERRDAIELETHPFGVIEGPVEQIGLTRPDGIEGCQHVEARVAVELGGRMSSCRY